MAKEPKPLHLATSMKELNSHTINQKLQTSNPKLLCKSADKVYLAAHDKILEGDQEHAYVLLLRYLDVVKAIRSSKEYKTNKKAFEGLLDMMKFKRALEDAEKLASNLQTRYEALRLSKDEETGSNDKAHDLSTEQDSFEPSLTTEQLYELLDGSGDATLVLDTRSRSDYVTSHVDSKKFPQWISVPEEVIKNGNFSTFVSSSNQKVWSERGSKRTKIILVDSNSTFDSLSAPSDSKLPILLLKEALNNEGLNVSILDGGYNMWFLSYAPLCVGKWKGKSSTDIAISNNQTGDLSYPSFSTSETPLQENTAILHPVQPPVINRSTKPTANNVQSPSSHILQQTNSHVTPPSNHVIMPSNHVTPLSSHVIPPSNHVIMPSDHVTPQSSHVIPPSNHVIMPSDHVTPQSSHVIPPSNHVIMPSDHVTLPSNHMMQSNMNFTVPPPFINVQPLPPAPMANIPLDLEGRGLVLSNDLEQPQPIQFMDDWYPTHSTDNYQQLYDSTSYPVPPTNITNNEAIENNPRVAHGPMPIPPSYEAAAHLPSYSPVQPPLPPPISIPHEGTTLKEEEKQSISDSDYVKELVHKSIEEERKKLDAERAKMKEEMKEELREEREKNKAALAEEREKQNKVFEDMKEQMEKQMSLRLDQMKQEYEHEKEAILKEREEMKHYWESRLHNNQQQRQVVINKGLPTGWEKRLDHTTGRFYYIDHNTRTTHWNPPTSLLQYQSEVQRQKQLAEEIKHPQYYQYSGIPPSGTLMVPPSGTPSSTPMVPPSGTPSSTPMVPPSVTPSSTPMVTPSSTPMVPPSSTPMVPPNGTPTGTPVVPPSGTPSGIPSGTPMVHPIPENSTNNPTSTSGIPTSTGTVVPSTGNSAVPSNSKGQTADSFVQPSKSFPTIDRSTKPRPQVTSMPLEVYRQKMLNLHPVQGGMGPGLTGMRNLGNTCFMNSVIQCLCATPPLVAYFNHNLYRKDLNRTNPLGSGGILAEEFYILVASIWLGKFRYITARDFKNIISQVAPYFAGNQQHDSQEFLVYLLDGLHEDLNKVLVKSYTQLPEFDKVTDNIAARQSWQAHKKINDSIIIDLFHGLLKSTITCMSCGKQKVMFEPFISLSVPIPQGRSSCNYHDCLRLFTAKERMTANNKWFCPQCKTLRDSEKTLFIWKLPPVLLLHFKRFQDKGNVREKLTTHISFPLENLDLSSYIVGPKPTKSYDLYAISNHTGNLQGGHYTACCKHPRNQKFYFFDDQDIREANSRDLSSSSAYLLFYTCENFKI